MRVGRRRREANRRSIIDMLETTPARVAQPSSPAANDELAGDIDFDWRPRPLEKVVSGDRSFRWPIIGAALVLGALAIIAVRGLGTISDTQADERLADYRTELGRFSDAVVDLEAALPNIDIDAALAFSLATDQLLSVASEDLPGLPPFVPQGSLGDVAAAQDHLLAMVDVATAISADLDTASTYLAAAEALFSVPPLPFEAPDELIEPASQAIADMQTETLRTLAGLEPNTTFGDYLDRLDEALGSIPDWSDRYLLALRRGDTEAANALIAEITARRQLLDAELEVALTSVSRTVSELIEDIRTAIAQAEVLTATR